MQNIPTKNTGDEYSASEFNSSNDEIKNAIEDSSVVLSGSDFHQISKSIANYVAHGDYYTDSGAANAYILAVQGSKKGPTLLADGLRARFRVVNSNTGASTINVNSLGIKNIKKYGGAIDLEAGDLVQDQVAEVVYVSSLGVFELASVENPILIESIPLFLNKKGFILSNNTTDADNDLDISPGTFSNTITADAFTLSSILTKKIDANWSAGTNAGGFPSALTLTADTWYDVLAIAKPDGTVDVGFDTTLTATNLLSDATGYTFYRRIGAIFYQSGTPDFIIEFTQIDDRFILHNPIAITPSITATYATYEIAVPPRVNVEATLNCSITTATASDAMKIKSTFQTTGIEVNWCSIGNDARGTAQIISDTSSQIDAKRDGVTSAAGYQISVYSYKEFF